MTGTDRSNPQLVVYTSHLLTGMRGKAARDERDAIAYGTGYRRSQRRASRMLAMRGLR